MSFLKELLNQLNMFEIHCPTEGTLEQIGDLLKY
jgi:hypothetical protein